MKKKLIALFATCSMITTIAAGMVQTAYADGDPISIVVSDGATDTQKVLTINYACNGIMTFEGYLTFDNDDVTINSTTFNLAYPSGMGDKNSAVYEADPSRGYQIMITTYDDYAMVNDAKSVATVNITVPSDVDVEATLKFEVLQEADWTDVECAPITVTIPKKAAPVPSKTPAAVTAVEKQNTEAIYGTGEYKAQTADIYGVQITANDEAVSGAKIYFDDVHQNTITFNTVCSGGGTIEFAVILANVTGGTLPSLSEATITPILATIE